MNNDLRDVVHNWLHKAENDLKTAQDELQTPDPATDMVCFHTQQCVEKYLKAYLTQARRSFRRTHDIAELIESAKQVEPEFEVLYGLRADHLTIYGVDIRYPDEFYMPTPDEARQALHIALAVREWILDRLTRLDP